MKINFTIILIYFAFVTYLNTQPKENWIKIYDGENKQIFIDVLNLNMNENVINVWVYEQFKDPVDLKEFDNEIYFIKTRYNINKEISRYRIEDVIYYDRDKNVVKSFNYNFSYQDPIYKYYLPIMNNSEIEIILKKCLEYLENSKN